MNVLLWNQEYHKITLINAIDQTKAFQLKIVLNEKKNCTNQIITFVEYEI